ncbi:hypothetical protein EON68_01010 [archaeon]|nr:MAG: hypothetical protein EON68_01010 [archaeon]
MVQTSLILHHVLEGREGLQAHAARVAKIGGNGSEPLATVVPTHYVTAPPPARVKARSRAAAAAGAGEDEAKRGVEAAKEAALPLALVITVRPAAVARCASACAARGVSCCIRSAGVAIIQSGGGHGRRQHRRV